MSASSFTRPMFTARNVFSSSLTISATRGELTGTMVSIAAPYSAAASAEQSGVAPPTTFGTLRVWNVGVARIHALGRERQEDVAADLEAAALERRLHHLVGRARVGRGLEDDQHAGMEVRRDRLDRRDHEGEVRILGLAERRRHADVHGVERPQHGEVGGRREPPGGHEAGDLLVRHVRDVRLAAVHRGDLGAVEVDADGVEPGAGELDGERQPDVPEADDARARAPRGDLLEQDGGDWRHQAGSSLAMTGHERSSSAAAGPANARRRRAHSPRGSASNGDTIWRCAGESGCVTGTGGQLPVPTAGVAAV